MNSFLILLFTGLVFSAPNTTIKEKCNLKKEKAFGSFSGKVEKVADGDTIDVKTASGKIRRIRFLHIDTPETKFQGKSQGRAGEMAARRMEELLPVDSKVKVTYEEKPCDMYGRYLGVVSKNDININLQMVKEGLAASLCFAPNLIGCEKFIHASKEAMENPKNVFTAHSALIPHEFRFEESGKPEAPFVGDFESKKIFPFEKWKEIEPLNRIFFTRVEDIVSPYKLE